MSKNKKRGRRTKHPGVHRVRPGVFRLRVRVFGAELQSTVEARNANQAAALRLEWIEQLKQGSKATTRIGIADSSTVGEAVGRWLTRKLEARRVDGSTRLTPATLDRYERSVRVAIIPFLGQVPVARLTASVIREWRDTLGTEYRANTVNSHLRILRAALREELSLDVAGMVRALDVDDTWITDEEPNRLTAQEAAAFMAAARRLHPRHSIFAEFLLFTGARIGTALAVRWEDIDRELGQVTFRRRISAGQVVPGVKRGRQSVDRVPLAPSVLERLDELPAEYNEAQLESGWIFPSWTGGLKARSHLDAPLREWCREAGISKRITPHGLRRTAVLLWKEAGGTEIAKRVAGHLTEQMHRHYSGGPSREEQRVAAGRVALQLVGGGSSG